MISSFEGSTSTRISYVWMYGTTAWGYHDKGKRRVERHEG